MPEETNVLLVITDTGLRGLFYINVPADTIHAFEGETLRGTDFPLAITVDESRRSVFWISGNELGYSYRVMNTSLYKGTTTTAIKLPGQPSSSTSSTLLLVAMALLIK